ncbi:COG1470 family protein [Jatrophihabitans fulvus]
MSTTATLEQPQVSLAAGSETVVPLIIRNDGSLVEGYRIEPVGVPAQWITVDPPEVSLYPGDSTTARLTIRPPRSSGVPAGQLAYGVRVVPTERPNEAIVPEGMVEVLPFLETTAELIPRTSRGKRSAKHQIAVDNRGNVPVGLLFDAVDPTDALTIDVDPGFTVGPGNAAFVDVLVRTRRRIWRGAPVTHPFAVNVVPHDGPPVVLDGTHLQEPVFPKWILKALLALIALLALLAALWFLVLKPAVESAAKDAAKEAVAAPVDKAQQQAAAAAKKADAAQQAAAKGGGGGAKSSGAAAAPAAQPTSQRLNVITARGATNSQTLAVAGDRSMQVTDIVLENPQGDIGRLQVSRGNTVLLVLALENFRDIDYHFVSPIVVGAGGSLKATVTCTRVGKPVGSTPTTCDTSVLIGGTTTKTSR